MKEYIYVVRGGELKRILTGQWVSIKKDGTIWHQGNPLLGLTDPEVKTKALAAVKAQRYNDIPAEAFTHLGDNSNGLWVGDEEKWQKHPVKIEIEKAKKAEKEKEANQVKIYLSSRGWGDYSSLEWIGDITRSDAEILDECLHMLATGHDVDTPDQSDIDVLLKIESARRRHNAPKEHYVETPHGVGYCYSCQSHCYGDCGNYSTNPGTKYKREFKEAIAEENYGIQD